MGAETRIADPWHKETADWITPDTEVYVCRLFTKDFLNGLLCDRAYLTESSMKQHFWFLMKKAKVEFTKMPFSKYLKLHIEECEGMNPFWSIGRYEFLTEYNKKWKLQTS